MDITLEDEQASLAFAQKLTTFLQPTDVVLLHGDLGAGKSFLSRAIIQTAAGMEIEVPSPTFTLVQTYALEKFEIWHFDLYRLSHPDEIIELGWDDAYGQAVLLIEWPDRLGDLRPDQYIDITVSFVENETDKRQVAVTLHDMPFERTEKLREILT